jgi:methyl-accepting chemotaxis protein
VVLTLTRSDEARALPDAVDHAPTGLPYAAAAPAPEQAPAARSRRGRAPIWAKLAAIALVFTIPLATTTWFLLEEQSIKIEFARSELRGDEYLRPASELLQAVTAHRSALHAGDRAAATAGAVEAALAELAAVDERLAGHLETTAEGLQARDRAGSLPAALAATWDEAAASDPGDAEAALDEMALAVRALITHVGDTSQLILDPDLDTYYVMDAFLLRMPEVVSRAHVVADGLVDQAEAGAEPTPELMGEAALLAQHATAVVDDIATSIREAPAFSGSATLDVLTAPAARTAEAATALAALATSDEVPDAGAVREALTGVETATAALWPALLDEQDAMLEVRLDGDLGRQRNAFVSVLVAVAVSAVLTLLVARRITRNVGAVAAAARHVAAGDLTRRATVSSDDEIGAMGDAFNAMANGMQRLVAGVQRAGVDVSAAAAQLSGSSEELAATTSQQSAAVTETTATTEELARASSSIADTVDELATQAADTRANLAEAEQGVLASGERTVALASSIRDISGILELINEIADQTNLLAVNAAIEAARAGEDGLGFAVVADEVRRLAERSKQSASDIAGIVEGVQTETNATVMAMEKGASQMRSGLAMLDRVADATEQVRITTQQQRSATAQVVETMEQLTEASRQVSMTAHQIATSATTLAGLASDLDASARSVSAD